MKYFPKWGLIFAIVAILISGTVVPAAAGDTVELLVVTRQGAQRNLQWPSCVVRVRRIPGSPIYRLWVEEGCAEDTINALKTSPFIRSVERAGQLSISSRQFGDITDKAGDGETEAVGPVGGVHTEYAWERAINTLALSRLGNGSGTVVAVMDTGIDLQNPLFSSRLWRNPGEVAGDGMDNDGNGYRDDENGWNFGDGDSNLQDTEGHGTEVASFIFNIAPQCTLLPLKLNRGSAETFGMGALIEGMYYAVSAGARVINMSFSSTGYSAALAHAIEDAKHAGVVLVGAAGNNGWTVEFPANLDDVIAVGALSPDSSVAWFSSIGPELGLTAPGDSILATGLGGVQEYVSGTSFSSAIVSGAAAVIRSMNPHLEVNTVRKLLLAGARDLGPPGFDSYYGAGALDGSLLWGAATPRVLNAASPFFMHARNLPLDLMFSLPPTDSEVHVFLVVLSDFGQMWLDSGGTWHEMVVDPLSEFSCLALYGEPVNGILFGDEGVFPALDVHSWKPGAYRWGMAVEDESGRLVAPIGWTNMMLF